MAVPTEKRCSKCGETKPASDFTLVESKNRNPYRRGYCRTCEAAYHRVRVAGKRKEPAWLHNRWQTNLKSKYGITKDQYIDMMLEQDFKCPLCDKPQLAFVVDHDHACCDRQGSCGACVRSLLCDNCNKMLGHARDNAATLKRASEYLEAANGAHA